MSAGPILSGLLDGPVPPDMPKAACAHPGVDPDLWTPEPGDTDAAEAAKQICKFCPELTRCRDWALAHAADDNAIYGGMERIDRVGVTARQAATLHLIHRSPGITIAELVPLLDQSNTAVSRYAKALVTKGLASFTRAGSKKQHFTCTDAGQAWCNTHLEAA